MRNVNLSKAVIVGCMFLVASACIFVKDQKSVAMWTIE